MSASHEVAPHVVRGRLARALSFAAGMWLLTHLVHALASLGSVDHVAPYLVGVGLWLGGSALALHVAGATGDPARERAEAVVVALLVPVVSALDVFALTRGDVATYANWANGGTSVMLIVLVLRRHGRLAVAAGGALLAVQTCAAVRNGSSFSPDVIGSLFVPVPLWLLGSWAVRRHIGRADRLAAGLRFQRAAEAAELLLGERWDEVRAEHRADLDDAVLPLMHEVVALPSDGNVTPEQRARARELSGRLRDAILARSLMTRTLQRQVGEARGRGARVMLHNALEDGAALHALREMVGRLLELPGLELLSVRTSHDPGRATVVVRGDAVFAARGRDAVEAVVGVAVPWWSSTQTHDLDGDVMVQLSGPYVDGAAS